MGGRRGTNRARRRSRCATTDATCAFHGAQLTSSFEIAFDFMRICPVSQPQSIRPCPDAHSSCRHRSQDPLCRGRVAVLSRLCASSDSGEMTGKKSPRPVLPKKKSKRDRARPFRPTVDGGGSTRVAGGRGRWRSTEFALSTWTR